MPIYQFDPIDLDHPDWTGSTFAGRCRVHAPNEEMARKFLDTMYRRTAGRTPSGYLPQSPWLKRERSKCSAPQFDDKPLYRVGRIEERRPSSHESTQSWSSDEDGLWMVAAEGDPPSGDRERETVLETASGQLASEMRGQPATSGTGTARPAVVTGPTLVTPEVLEGVIQKRTTLNHQASALLASLDDLIGPEGIPPERRNESLSENLGIGPEVNETEILTLLRELRDEIRAFREALENAGSDPEKLEPAMLARLGDIVIEHLVALSKNKILLSIEGASLGGMLWTYLVQTRLIDTSSGIELLKVIFRAGS